MKKLSLFLLALLTISLFSSCGTGEPQNASSAESSNANISSQLLEDDEYKLFYGTWKTTRIVYVVPRPGEPLDHLIGQEIFLSKDAIIINGSMPFTNPQYAYEIAPYNTESDQHHLSAFDFQGNYFVAVSPYWNGIANATDFVKEITGPFIIIDNNTLALVTPFHYVEMKRVSYIDENMQSIYG